MLKFKSLQQRVSIFMLLPVGLLLIVMGFAGIIYASNRLLTQWGEATILKLQRAAHHVDMRLSRPKEMLKMFHRTAGMPHAADIQSLILDQLNGLEWVSRVDLDRVKNEDGKSMSDQMHPHHSQMAGPGGLRRRDALMMMPFHRGSIVGITSPRFDASAGRQTVSLLSDLKDKNDQTVGRLAVEIPFDSLVNTIEVTGWWREHKAFLVDDSGNVLTSNLKEPRKRFGENGDPLERSTLKSMASLPFGTVFGKGFPPREISGFYKLKEAPWTLVIMAPGKEILSRIIQFQIYYLIFGGIFILVILFLIRFVTSRTVSAVREVSHAAQRVAHGDYGISLPVRTQDEVGELIHSFNTMVLQLEERTRLKNSLNLAKEVQQNLLPGKPVQNRFLDIAGQSIYCDETGGDYYDYFTFPEMGPDRMGVAVGDVADHGIAAALLMTTARAFIRSRIIQSTDLSQITTDVNRLLCMDTADNGNFMTFFLMLFNTGSREIRWVRAGHDPALLYDAATDEFVDLDGKGLALGVDETYPYQEYRRSDWHYGQIVVIGTDGIWDTENSQGDRFGKDRLKKVLRQASHASAAAILKAVTDAISDFRGKEIQNDDVTLVVVKANPETSNQRRDA